MASIVYTGQLVWVKPINKIAIVRSKSKEKVDFFFTDRNSIKTGKTEWRNIYHIFDKTENDEHATGYLNIYHGPYCTFKLNGEIENKFINKNRSEFAKTLREVKTKISKKKFITDL